MIRGIRPSLIPGLPLSMGPLTEGRLLALGYPAVSDYLMANRDTLGLPDARVPMLWCQEKQSATA